jgi:hypothetical protein
VRVEDERSGLRLKTGVDKGALEATPRRPLCRATSVGRHKHSSYPTWSQTTLERGRQRSFRAAGCNRLTIFFRSDLTTSSSPVSRACPSRKAGTTSTSSRSLLTSGRWLTDRYPLALRCRPRLDSVSGLATRSPRVLSCYSDVGCPSPINTTPSDTPPSGIAAPIGNVDISHHSAMSESLNGAREIELNYRRNGRPNQPSSPPSNLFAELSPVKGVARRARHITRTKPFSLAQRHRPLCLPACYLECEERRSAVDSSDFVSDRGGVQKFQRN